MFKRTIYAFWGSFDTSVIARVRRTDWQKYISHRQMTMWFKNAQQGTEGQPLHVFQFEIHPTLTSCSRSNSLTPSLKRTHSKHLNRKLLVWVFEALKTCNSKRLKRFKHRTLSYNRDYRVHKVKGRLFRRFVPGNRKWIPQLNTIWLIVFFNVEAFRAFF